MNLTGCSDLTMEIAPGSDGIVITIRFDTPLQAREAFEKLKRQSDGGMLELRFTTGPRITEH